MDRVIEADGYGICLFSSSILQDFLKQEKIRKRKLLSLFQKEEELYLKTLEKGVWIPLSGIDCCGYVIKIDGQDEAFDDHWLKKVEYNGFNIDIKNGLWVTAINQLEPFEPNEYDLKKEEYYTTQPFHQEHYHSPKVRWYKTLDGYINYNAIKLDILDGKYLLLIQGYVRKEKVSNKPNRGFVLSFQKVDSFQDYKDPREDEYDFHI